MDNVKFFDERVEDTYFKYINSFKGTNEEIINHIKTLRKCFDNLCKYYTYLGIEISSIYKSDRGRIEDFENKLKNLNTTSFEKDISIIQMFKILAFYEEILKEIEGIYVLTRKLNEGETINEFRKL